MEPNDMDTEDEWIETRAARWIEQSRAERMHRKAWCWFMRGNEKCVCFPFILEEVKRIKKEMKDEHP